ncbi:MAG: hypothetical protein ACOC7R_02460 [Planctomycetota bacterium]
MRIDRAIGTFVIAGVLVAAVLAVQAQMHGQGRQQQDPRQGRDMPMRRQDGQGRGMPKDRQDMRDRCRDMMQRMEQMQQKMQQQDDELQQQLQTMEQAEGQAKIDAMADTVHLLVQQRRQRDQQRMDMRQRMMQHMGDHMMMNRQDQDGGGQMMMDCPMMQGQGMQKRGMRGRMHGRPPGDDAQEAPAQPDQDQETQGGAGRQQS